MFRGIKFTQQPDAVGSWPLLSMMRHQRHTKLPGSCLVVIIMTVVALERLDVDLERCHKQTSAQRPNGTQGPSTLCLLTARACELVRGRPVSLDKFEYVDIKSFSARWPHGPMAYGFLASRTRNGIFRSDAHGFLQALLTMCWQDCSQGCKTLQTTSDSNTMVSSTRT